MSNDPGPGARPVATYGGTIVSARIEHVPAATAATGGGRSHRRLLAVPLALVAWLLSAVPAAAQEAGAGGASAEEVTISSIAALLFLAGAAGVVVAYRRGKLASLDRLAAFSGRVSGQPGWAALPLAIAGVSLIVAVFGFYWDVATHIDHGRDEGVFGNAAHWPILVGLTGLALAGLVSMLLGTDRQRAGGVEPPRLSWRTVPVGGALLFLCGVIALIGFPIDDVWHRIFGQDVTLWSPPHIQMVFGASLCTIAMWILFVEAERAQPQDPASPRRRHLIEVALAGATLIGLSTLQGEFDFAVPQFRLLFQPLLIAIAAGIALVAARIRLGRGGALLAVAFFLAVRGITSLFVSGVFEQVTFHMPLYLGAALVVELVAARISPDRQLTFGAVAGLGVGTLGMATEAVWSHVWMPIPWTATLLPEALFVVVPAAVAAGLVGGFLGRGLTRPGVPRERVPSWLAPAATLVLVVTMAYPLPTTGADAEAEMSLTAVPAPEGSTGGDHVEATIRVTPPEVVEGAQWFNVIAWQGAAWWSEEATHLIELEEVGDGVYRTTSPVPIHGEWKAMVRLHNDRVMAAAPIFLPEDPAIPAEEVPAEPEMTRAFTADHEILLREARETAPWVPMTAQAIMALIAAGWLAAFIAGTRHLRRTRPGDPAVLLDDEERSPQPVR
jgi:hypothetical protein